MNEPLLSYNNYVLVALDFPNMVSTIFNNYSVAKLGCHPEVSQYIAQDFLPAGKKHFPSPLHTYLIIFEHYFQHIYVYIYIHTCMHTYIHVYMYTYNGIMYVICLFVYLFEYYMYIYIHTYIYILEIMSYYELCTIH